MERGGTRPPSAAPSLPRDWASHKLVCGSTIPLRHHWNSLTGGELGGFVACSASELTVARDNRCGAGATERTGREETVFTDLAKQRYM